MWQGGMVLSPVSYCSIWRGERIKAAGWQTKGRETTGGLTSCLIVLMFQSKIELLLKCEPR